MATTIATKADLQLLKQELLARLGSMLMLGLGLLLAALKLT